MVSCSGKSLVPVSIGALQSFLNSIVTPDKLAEFNVKLDGRSSIKANFVKLSGTTLTVYTGAIINLGHVKFPDVVDSESLLMLFILYGIKKAGSRVDFEVKSSDQSVAAVKCDKDFQALMGNLHLFVGKFKAMNESTIVSEAVSPPVKVSTEKAMEEAKKEKPKQEKKEKVPVSEFKDVPLGETPKIEVPADLDLRMV